MAEEQLSPYRAAGADYGCNGCGAVIPEGAHVHHGQSDGELTWVQALNADGEILHECGEVPGG